MSELHQAVDDGDMERIGLLLDQGADVDAREEGGITPLMRAAMASEVVVRMLLQNGAQILLEDDRGYSALYYAGWMGDEQTIRTLLEWGADRNPVQVQRAFEATFVDFNQDKAPLFLALGARPNLYEALMLGDMETVRRLIQEGKVDVKHDAGPLYAAISADNVEAVRLVLKHGADPSAVRSGYDAPLLTALRACVNSGAIVHSLLEAGADMHCRDVQGETAFTYKYDRQGLEALQAMVAFGADVNTRNVLGETTMMRAAAGGQVFVVQYLLEQGADPLLKDNRGWTALTHATRAGKAAVIRLLTSDPQEWRLPREQTSETHRWKAEEQEDDSSGDGPTGTATGR